MDENCVLKSEHSVPLYKRLVRLYNYLNHRLPEYIGSIHKNESNGEKE